MKKNILKTAKILLPLLLGGFLVYTSYHQFSDAERDAVFSSIKDAEYSWVILGMFIAFLSHLSRAWRWNYMLQTLGKPPKFVTNVMAIGAGYAMNLIIPRSGEISRAAIVNRTDQVPMDKAIGTIIAERVLDLIILLAITLTAVLSAGDEIIFFFRDLVNSAFAKASTQKITIILAVFLVIMIILFIVLKKIGLLEKIKGFMKGIKDGFGTIWTMKKKWLYLLHSIFIWTMYLLMFYVCIFAIPGTALLPVSAILCAFVAGSFAVAFTNGGFGAYPYLIAQVLLVFGVSEVIGTSFGWILWLSQTLLVIIYGLLSFLMLSLRSSVLAK